MAFVQKNLSVLAYANGFTLWHYVTPDKVAAVRVPGYFDRANDLLRKADMILLNAGDVSGTLVVSGFEPITVQSATIDVMAGG